MESNNKVLIIKSFKDEFEKFYNDRMQKKGVEVWNSYVDIKNNYSNFITVQTKLLYKMIKNGWISDIRKCKNIIVFDSYTYIPWLFLFKKHETRIILWKWNIATSKIIPRIRFLQRFCEVWTFDMNDAERYGWYFNNQFYFYPNGEGFSRFLNINGETVFFIGNDKGRYVYLHKIYNTLKQYGIDCFFWMIKDENKQYNAEDNEWIKDIGMPYRQVLEHISKCNAILDLVQDAQRGFTIRVLEAIFYQKKLITNNKEILTSDLYLSNNIFVIGYDNWDDIHNFMQKPYKELAKEVLDRYTFDSWLKNFDERYLNENSYKLLR